jgi:squalene synthase HpnC
LPARLRDPICALYAFARRADDIADEGELDAATRLRQLNEQRALLNAAASGSSASDDPVAVALSDCLRRHTLSPGPLHDLLDAFARDTRQHRYASFNELLDYCRQSANPVGRLLLQLLGVDDADSLHQSDALCSALQLINMLQDLSDDLLQRDRLYLPQQDLRDCGVKEPDLLDPAPNPATRQALDALLARQLARCQQLLELSRPLPKRLGGCFGLELRLVHLAAERLVERLESAPQNWPQRTPHLGFRDVAILVLRLLRRR